MSYSFTKESIRCVIWNWYCSTYYHYFDQSWCSKRKILPPIFDFVHNVVASLWIGSVIYLAFVVMPKLKQMQDDHASMSVLSLIIPRFSTIVVALLGIVVITGPSLLYVLENNLSLTLASIYGEILVVKLSLAGAMIGLGAFNQRIIQQKAFNAIPLSTSDLHNKSLTIV